MPHRYRALSTGDIHNEPSASEDELSDSHLSTKSEGPNFNRRASQGCVRDQLSQKFYSRPDTPTRVLESSFRVSSPNINRIPKSVRFEFPEQDHFEAKALKRKAEVEVTDSQILAAQVRQVAEAMKANVDKLLDREAKLTDLDLDTSADQKHLKKGYYCFTIHSEPNQRTKFQWRKPKSLLLIVTGITVICSSLALILILLFMEIF